MSRLLRPVAVVLAVFTVLTGVVYPLAVTAAAQLMFPDQANGSLVRVAGVVVGSELIGQSFDNPRYFTGRPSATSPFPCNAAASSGSNLGPSNPALTSAVGERVAALRAADLALTSQAVPGDLVTTSASGLDPHISPAAALVQVDRVARVRGLPVNRVQALVTEHIEGRTFGVLGEPRVNVLQLNLALDASE